MKNATRCIELPFVTLAFKGCSSITVHILLSELGFNVTKAISMQPSPSINAGCIESAYLPYTTGVMRATGVPSSSTTTAV